MIVGNTDEVIDNVHLPDDGGKEDPVNLNREDEGEVEEQGGGVPQQHLGRDLLSDRYGRGVFTSLIDQALMIVTGTSVSLRRRARSSSSCHSPDTCRKQFNFAPRF